MGTAVTAQLIDDTADGPWVLPKSWAWVPLGRLGDWIGGGTPSKANPAFWSNGTVPWVSPKDMKVPVIGETEDKITPEAVEGSSAKYVPAGSVLMVMRSGILRHSFPVAITDRIVTLNQDLRALTPHKTVRSDYVARYLALAATRVLHDCSKDGTTVNSIEAAALERVPVPLAPLAEQRRIVARVDELFAEIAEGEAALAEARKGLDTFRRALLKAAITGELTKDWREANPASESADDLLVRIRTKQMGESSARNRAPRDAKALDPSALPILPEGWVWARAEEVTSVITKGTTPPRQTMTARGEIPYLKIQNLDFDGSLHFDRTKVFIDRATHSKLLARSVVYPGDLLINIVGPPLGQTAIVPSDYPEWNMNQAIAVFRCLPGINVEYMNLFLMSSNALIELETRSKATSGQVNVTLEVCRNIAVPVPPAREAMEIVRRVSEALTANADALTMLEAEAADAARLKQSILKAAFGGRLVTQDPADEPATALLAGLAAEAPAPTASRGRARKQTA